jgi:hypothetical protein
MAETNASPDGGKGSLTEVRYSLRELLKEVQAEREGSSIGQEIVDQSEIGKLFNRKKKVRRGEAGK